MGIYDVDGATDRLRLFAGEFNFAARKRAATELRDAVVKAFGDAAGPVYFDLEGSPDPSQLLIYVKDIGRGSVGSVGFDQNGAWIRREHGTAEILPLRFDATRARWSGTEEDTSRHPIPGGERTYRDAVHVVVEEIIKATRAALSKS